MQRHYLEEDFANAIADASQDASMRFHIGHLEKFPELLTWLCEHFDKISDANMAHNDLVELTLTHMKNASLTPEFFFELANYSKAICEGIEKDTDRCEANCEKYYRCSNIAMADDRYKKLEALGICLVMHKNITCSDTQNDNSHSSAARYLNGSMDLNDFFISQCGKEAV